jgi:hypothetical protein
LVQPPALRLSSLVMAAAERSQVALADMCLHLRFITPDDPGTVAAASIPPRQSSIVPQSPV